MSLLLTEDFSFNFPTPTGTPDQDVVLGRFQEFVGPTPDSSFPAPIYPQFRILSADEATRNGTLYTYTAHRGRNVGEEPTGQYSFTRPYEIPLIEQHRMQDTESLPASEIYGRIIQAKLVKDKASGRAHLAGLGMVPHPKAIHEILSGLWLTGSLGSVVPSAHCTICGANVAGQEAMARHPHRRFKHYRAAKANEEADASGWSECDPKDSGSKLCLTAVDAYRAMEYSKVVTPSDKASLVVNRNTQLTPSPDFAAVTGESFLSPVPTTSLWTPMAASSSRGISERGERYIDLVTGREVASTDLGLFSGEALSQHLEHYIDSTDWVSEATLHLPPMHIAESADVLFVEEVDSAVSESVPGDAPTDSLPSAADSAETSTESADTPSASCLPFVLIGESAFPVGDRAQWRASVRHARSLPDKQQASKISVALLREGVRRGFHFNH